MKVEKRNKGKETKKLKNKTERQLKYSERYSNINLCSFCLNVRGDTCLLPRSLLLPVTGEIFIHTKRTIKYLGLHFFRQECLILLQLFTWIISIGLTTRCKERGCSLLIFEAHQVAKSFSFFICL